MNEIVIRPHEHDRTQTITLRDITAPVFRQRRLAVLLFLGIFLGAILSALLLPKNYQAEMTILVNRERVDPVVTSDQESPVAVAALPAVTEEDLNSEVELLKGRDLLEKVVLATRLDAQPESRWQRVEERAADYLRGGRPDDATRLARAVQTLDNRLVIEPLKKTTMIRVAYSSNNPREAARVLQTLGTLYQEKHAAVHRPAGTFGFFDQEAARYRGELAADEFRLMQFDKTEGLVDAAEQKQLVLQQLSSFEAEWEQAQAGSFAAKMRAVALQHEEEQTPERQTIQVQTIDNAQLLSSLESTLLSLELKRSEMLMKYSPAYPPVEEVERQLAATRQAIAAAEKSPVQQVTSARIPAQDWMSTELAKAQTDRAELDAETAAKARVVRHYENVAHQLDVQGIAQEDLIRDVKTAQDNYLLYLRKREEARISDALDSRRIVNVSIAEAATVPALATLHLGWLLIGGFFLGGTISVGAAYAVDEMDPRFRTPEELRRYLDMKVLASIPKNLPGEDARR